MSDRPISVAHGASVARGTTRGSKAENPAGDGTITDPADLHHLADMAIAEAGTALVLGITASSERQNAADRDPLPALVVDLARSLTGHGVLLPLDMPRRMDSPTFLADMGAMSQTFSFSLIMCRGILSTGYRNSSATGGSKQTSCL